MKFQSPNLRTTAAKQYNSDGWDTQFIHMPVLGELYFTATMNYVTSRLVTLLMMQERLGTHSRSNLLSYMVGQSFQRLFL